MESGYGRKIPLRKVVFVLLSVSFLLCFGIISLTMGEALNHLVVRANSGRMPVAYAENERLGTIILFPRFAECTLPSDEKNVPGVHTEFTTTTKLPLLADRFLLRMLNECEVQSFPSFAEKKFRQMKLVSPVGEGIVSIGDLFMWTGIFCYYASCLGLLLSAIFALHVLRPSRNASS